MNDYYKNLDPDVVKRMLHDLEQGLFQLSDAIHKLPDVPSIDVLHALSSTAMNSQKGSMFWSIGKEMQIKHGISAIPPNAELEAAAGLWKIIRDAIETASEQ